MQPANLAVALRRRTPWEATDLGLAMLQRWWRPVFAAHALVFLPITFVVVTLGWAFDAIWAAMLVIWWLEPVYDRVILHVLSRAVFGEVPDVLTVLRSAPQWLNNTGLGSALTLDRADMARSFNLPVRQLEGQRGREARERRRVLGRRTRGQAVWLTVVWIHFEAALLFSAGAMAGLVLPAQLERTPGGDGAFFGFLEMLQMAGTADALLFAGVLLFLEPFYVAAGFGLYLNRRTLLEGWDIEVALRRIAERHAIALVVLAVAFTSIFPQSALAQDRSPKAEIAEVLKAPEFGYHRETLRWQPRDPAKPGDRKAPDMTGWHAIGYALARAAEVFMWGAAAALLAYAIGWLARRLPSLAQGPPEPYRPPPALFGMEIAPERLPADVPGAAAALARQGKLREALSLLYRGALSELVHRRGVKLLASHTEGEAVRLAGMAYFARLVEAWRSCAYASRNPGFEEIQALARDYKAAFA